MRAFLKKIVAFCLGFVLISNLIILTVCVGRYSLSNTNNYSSENKSPAIHFLFALIVEECEENDVKEVDLSHVFSRGRYSLVEVNNSIIKNQNSRFLFSIKSLLFKKLFLSYQQLKLGG